MSHSMFAYAILKDIENLLTQQDYLAFLIHIPEEAGFLHSHFSFFDPLLVQGVTQTHVLTMLPQGLAYL